MNKLRALEVHFTLIILHLKDIEAKGAICRHPAPHHRRPEGAERFPLRTTISSIIF